MRWEQLFDDFEGQIRASRMADARAEVADLVRAERAGILLADRLRAALGRELRLEVDGVDPVEGVLLDATREWLLLATSAVRRALVPTATLVAVAGLDPHVAPAPGQVEARIGLGHALRALARDRAAVRVDVAGRCWLGRVERVGSDHVDLSVGEELRRSTPLAVPFTALRVVSTL
ncbi:hypothetical protein [Cellulomonas soli]|uniref:hypothetical protein n=1 Tax=Cellulomonas soli TaxID=931535 RepID=UPI0011BF7FA4|nr:hypothetical protein [Cellulomonas soli]NYI57504.1 hypothetical protein [Cellulomonas soli]